MSERPHIIIQDGIKSGYSGLRPGPNPYALGTTPRALWDIGWSVGDSLRKQHEAELETELRAVAARFEKALK